MFFSFLPPPNLLFLSNLFASNPQPETVQHSKQNKKHKFLNLIVRANYIPCWISWPCINVDSPSLHWFSGSTLIRTINWIPANAICTTVRTPKLQLSRRGGRKRRPRFCKTNKQKQNPSAPKTAAHRKFRTMPWAWKPADLREGNCGNADANLAHHLTLTFGALHSLHQGEHNGTCLIKWALINES